jgi:hypothetical protein
MRDLRPGAAFFGACLLALGLFAIYKASALPLGTLREPDSGLFPLAISIGLTLLAALAFRSNRDLTRSEVENAGIVRVLTLVAAVGVYAVLLPRVGFIICTTALLAIALRGLGKVGWAMTIVCAIGGAVGCYLLFTRLGSPLPAGWLGL